jgi:hypothetical protein
MQTDSPVHFTLGRKRANSGIGSRITNAPGSDFHMGKVAAMAFPCIQQRFFLGNQNDFHRVSPDMKAFITD